MTLQELESNQKLKYWYDHIRTQKSSGLSVEQYCNDHRLTQSTFYAYQKRIKQLICDEINTNNLTNAVVPFVQVKPEPVMNDDKVLITKGTIKIEIEAGTTFKTVEGLLRSLLC